eukprot:m.263262 g.263262  ORF g.263262 m.263262 type:complete len:582 (-) comp49592_c0_seq1:347-2092(-)
MSTPNSNSTLSQDSQANQHARDNGQADETRTDDPEEQNTASANPPLVVKEDHIVYIYFLPLCVVLQMWFYISWFAPTFCASNFIIFCNRLGQRPTSFLFCQGMSFLLVYMDRPVLVIICSMLVPLCYFATIASRKMFTQCWALVQQVCIQGGWPGAVHLKELGIQPVLALFVIGQAFWIVPGVVSFELPGELLHQLGAVKFSQMNGNVIEKFCNGAVYEGHVRQGWKHATGTYFTPWPVPCWKSAGYADIQFPKSETKSKFVFDNGHLRFDKKTVFLWGMQTHGTSPNVCTEPSLELIDATLEIAHATSMECQALRDSVDHTDYLLTKIISTVLEISRWIPLQWFNFKVSSLLVYSPVDLGPNRRRLCFDRPLYEHACHLSIWRQKFHELSIRNLSTPLLIVDMLNISVTALQANFYRVLDSVLTAENVTFYLEKFVSMIGQDPSVYSVSEYSIRPSNVTFENIMIFAHRVHNFHSHAFHWMTVLHMHHRFHKSKTLSNSEFREGIFKVFRLAREDSLVGLDHTVYHNLSLTDRSSLTTSTPEPNYARDMYNVLYNPTLDAFFVCFVAAVLLAVSFFKVSI